MSRKSRKRKFLAENHQVAAAVRQVKTEGGTQVSTLRTTEFHSGILPRPEQLEHYERIRPGITEVLLKMTQEESEHRRIQEAKAVDAGVKESALAQGNIRRGQWMAFGLAAAVIGVAVYFATLGHPGVAGTLVGTVIAALAAAFIIGERRK